MMYRVLKPVFKKTGELTASGQPFFRVDYWETIGKATSIADAKQQGFRAPVLELA